MTWTIVPITVPQAMSVAGWRYPPPYDVYDMGSGAVPALLDPANAYHAVVDGSDLVGFCCFGPDAQVSVGREAGWYPPDGLDVGLGLRPDLTGRGLGRTFLSAVLAEAASRAATLRLTVATVNARAFRLYIAGGFTPTAVSADGKYRLLILRCNSSPEGTAASPAQRLL